MDAKELKVQLKAAREAIGKKEYKEALKYCKNILKVEKNHYNALVFVGVAAEGLEQVDQARMAYQKAIEVDESQALAWQGLCGFYEKTGTNHQELLPVYEKLLEFKKGDAKKVKEIRVKMIAALQTLGENEKALALLKEMISEANPDEIDDDMWRSFLHLVDSTNSLERESDLVTTAYKRLLNNDNIDNVEKGQLHQRYINFLCKIDSNTDKIIQEAMMMSEAHPENIFPKELLCHVQLYSLIDCGLGTVHVGNALEKLQEIDGENAFVLFHKGAQLVKQKMLPDAKENLMKGLKTESGCAAAWTLLCQVHVELGDQVSSAKCVQKVESLIKKSDFCWFGFDKDCIGTYVQLLSAQAKALVKTIEARQEAVLLCKEILEKKQDNGKALQLMTGLLIDLQQWQDALKSVEELKPIDETKALILEAIIKLEMREYGTAEDRLKSVLEKDEGNPQALYHMGRLNWFKSKEDAQYARPSYDYFLQAAKADPYNANCFLYLGHYQTEILNDTEKGKKCYQKAYSLDSSNEEICLALVDTLSSTGQEEDAIKILESVTSLASAGTCKWAWLRLGLCQMKGDDSNQAIYSLQCALRADTNDYHCWECLGEAYLKRGSYTAALKAFTRATELQPETTYSFYQIGSIKLALGNFKEAIDDYLVILNRSPDYVPALKGIGEGYVLLEKASVKEFFHGRAIDYCQLAAKNLTRAAVKKPDLSCLWKLLGDCFCILHVLPPEDCHVEVPSKLLGAGQAAEHVTILEKDDILALGARCFGMAVKCKPECGPLWHDLGLAYMYQAKFAEKINASLLMNKAFQSLEKAVQCDSINHALWNTLGLVSLSKEIDNKALAQHCFIKSIHCEQNNAVAWTNLGVLYLQSDDVTLAHEAFKVAQSLDPAYVASWIGQALIAETVGQSEEAMDLFRHTTELGIHTEGALGYAQFVCSLLQDTEKMSSDWNKYVIEKMWAVPAASDAMAKYTDRIRTNPTAFNLYGLLLERQSLYKGAAKAFDTAVTLLRNDKERTEELRKSSMNLARVLVHHNEFEKAVQIYNEFPPSSVEEQCSLALALFKMDAFDESIAHYQCALTLTKEQLNNSGQKAKISAEDLAHIYALMGMVKYRAGLKTTGTADVDGAKDVLFQCTQTGGPPSIYGLNALMSLGLIQADLELASAVQAELHKFEEHCETADFNYMVASLHALKHELVEGKRTLARLIHKDPSQSNNWSYLVQYLLTHEKEINDTVARCCRIALHHDSQNSDKNLSTWLAVALLGSGQHSRTINDRDSFKAAQRAVILNPDKLECWITLIGSMYAELILKRCLGQEEELAQPLLTLITHFMAKVEGMLSQKSGNTPRLQAMHLWCVKQYVVALLAADRQEQSQEFLQQALWLYDEDIHLQNLLAYINQNFSVLKLNAVNDSQGFTRLILVQLYMARGLTEEAETILKMWLPQARTKPRKLLALVRLAFFAYKQIISGSSNGEAMQKLFTDACSEARKIERNCVAVHYMMGLLALFQKKDKQCKKSLQECINAWNDEQNLTFGKNKAEELLTKLMDKETTDVKAEQTPKKEVKVQKDPFDD